MSTINEGMIVVKTEPRDNDEHEMIEEVDEDDRRDLMRSLSTEEVQAQQKLRQYQQMGLIEVELGENDTRITTIPLSVPSSSFSLVQKTLEPPTYVISPQHIDENSTIQLIPSMKSNTGVIQKQVIPQGIIDASNIISLQNMAIRTTTIAPVGPNESESEIPNLSPDSGKLGFDVYLEKNREELLKSPYWLMSKITNKLYVNINKPVPFHIRFNQKLPRMNYMVRVMAVFNNHQYLRTIVTRCPNHSNPSDQTNIDFQYPNHVLRVDHPMVQYEKSSNGRLSALVPLELMSGGGVEASPVLVKFMCLNSCVGGINRRPLAVMFTLEHSGITIGRQVIDVRVCACPTRDFKNDEHAVLNKGLKRTSTPLEFRMGKKKLKGCKVKEEESDIFFIPVRGLDLYEYLKDMKTLYFKHHPEYAERNPDVDEDFHSKFIRTVIEDSQNNMARESEQVNTIHMNSSPMRSDSNIQIKYLIDDKKESDLDSNGTLNSPSNEPNSMDIEQSFENDDKYNKSSAKKDYHNKSNGVLVDKSPTKSERNSINKIVTKTTTSNASGPRHLPCVSVSRYHNSGNLVVPKPTVKRKFGHVRKINGDLSDFIKIEPAPSEETTLADIMNCNNDEMMAAHLLASNLGARPNFESLESIVKSHSMP